jgi:predicted kinase
VGKSTLAHRYAANHRGTLCLDVDILVGRVDGWREDFSAAFGVPATRGLALAKSHLRDGHDVVVPQLVTIFDQGNPYEAAATEVGARFVEVALLADIDEHNRRLREKRPTFDVDARIQSVLDRRPGGEDPRSSDGVSARTTGRDPARHHRADH